jgi:osmoprotectant transport system permease protein
MSERWAELLKQLPNFLGGHIMLSLAALATGLAVSVPLGIAVSRRPRLAELTLIVAGIIQTVPSLALLALMVVVLGWIGFEPAFAALALYSILPILAGTVTGLRGVDPTLVEAARGLGMNRRQLLFQVQLPLAAPVIISGIRTATVIVVGTATLASPVGGRSLGNYIFQGLESLNRLSVLFGCALVALLAVVLDQLIHLLELAAQRRSRTLAWVGGLGLFVVLAGGILPLVGRYLLSKERWVHVASGSFTEQHVLSELVERQLPAGYRADKRKSMSEGIQFLALRQNEIDCMTNYTGNIWTLIMREKSFPPAANRDERRRVVLQKVTDYLDKNWGVACLPLGFENAYTLAMRKGDAEARGIKSIPDLADKFKNFRLGCDQQFESRPEWFQVRDRYGLKPAEIRGMDAGIMYDALQKGQCDVIVAYSSDGRIKAHDLLLLDDAKDLFPPYDAVLLLSPKAATRPGFREALALLTGAIDQEKMRRANYRVDEEGWTYSQAAVGLLKEIERRE